MPVPAKKFYLTTPIYYVNARPHIGHAYTTIAADVIARRHRLLGDDTFFLTGTDEHGQKVQRSAAAAGIPPQQFTDEVSASFRSLWKRMGLTNDDYIRTTEARHHRGVQHLWRTLEANGAIYLSSYTGAYCVSDEAFVDLPAGTPCPDCGRPLETVTEENYFFRLSEYQLPILELIESGELKISPESTRNEVHKFLCGDLTVILQNNSLPLNQGLSMEDLSAAAEEMGLIRKTKHGYYYVPGALKDLSISRTTFDWGIPVPGNPKHVIYVWLDALANYITAIGYGSDDPAEQAKFAKYWPADIHLVGKEITRFHCVYWPAFLLAAGLPLPKSIVANGWLLFEESKMSKSRGNVVRTETILDAFGPLCPPVPVSLDSTGLQPGESGDRNESSGAPSLTGSHPGMGGRPTTEPSTPTISPFQQDKLRRRPQMSAPIPISSVSPHPIPETRGATALELAPTPGAPCMPEPHPGMSGKTTPADPKLAVVEALTAAKQTSAAEALDAALWTISDGEARIQTALSKTMLPFVLNPEAERTVRAALRDTGILKLTLLPSAAAPAAAKKPRPARTGSVQSKALEHPMVQQAQKLFSAEVQSVIDLREES